MLFVDLTDNDWYLFACMSNYTGSDGEGFIASTPSSASNEALHKAKKRKSTAPASATNESIEASVRAASHALKEITGKREHDEYPTDVRCFLMNVVCRPHRQ